MLWVLLSGTGTGRLVRMERRMNAAKQRGPRRKPAPEGSDLRLGQRFTFQHDNDLKHTAKTTLERLQDKFLTVLERPSQSPDLNPTEHLWRDLFTDASHPI
ncbi:hypothetical protein LDENG_00021840 [Lucifuga dentata]|nr:hypothetical protein LDENG_00021840 [Lucifuga dentata]